MASVADPGAATASGMHMRTKETKEGPRSQDGGGVFKHEEEATDHDASNNRPRRKRCVAACVLPRMPLVLGQNIGCMHACVRVCIRLCVR